MNDSKLQLAMQHHQSGRLAEAEALYRQIVDAEPGNSDALHLLGLAAHAGGRHAEAADWINRALAVDCDIPEFHLSLGSALESLGQHEKAIRCYVKSARLDPELAEAHVRLAQAYRQRGMIGDAVESMRTVAALRPTAQAYCSLAALLRQARRPREAIESLQQAIALKPDFAEAHYGLGMALQECDQADAAAESFRRAVSIRPEWPEAHNALACALIVQRQFVPAALACQKALALRPDYADAMLNLSMALAGQMRPAEAVACCQRLLQLRPESPDALNNLGYALSLQDRMVEALDAYQKALALRPSHANTIANVGMALHALRNPDAMATFQRALDLDPHNAAAHWNMGIALLSQGDFAQGWPKYEWRWKVRELGKRHPGFYAPQWDGSPLDGRRILLWTEAGYGDSMMFLRFVPQVAARDGRPIVCCQNDLFRLFSRAAGVDHVMDWSVLPRDHAAQQGIFDVHCPVMSLGSVLQVTPATIPAEPYLFADPDLVQKWKRRVTPDRTKKIGLVWANKPIPPGRSPPPEAWEALGGIPNLTYYSLQKKLPLGDIQPPRGIQLIDWTDEIGDFGDAAAFMANLDLVITVDTAAAHLAGAMGKPVWVLLKYVPCWRWMMDREDSPWYPTMRLFRQTAPGQWQMPLSRVAAELQSLASE